MLEWIIETCVWIPVNSGVKAGGESGRQTSKKTIHFSRSFFSSDVLFCMADASRSHIVDGRIVYTWSQTLDDVTVVVPDIPPAPARAFSVSIAPTRLTLGLAGNPPYLDVRCGAGLEGALSWRAPRGEEEARAVGGQHPFFNSNGPRFARPPLFSHVLPLPSSPARPRGPRQAQRIGVDVG